MIIINGKKYSGSSVSISGNRVIIDGKEVDGDTSPDGDGILEVRVEGDAANVESDVAISVNGNVHGNASAGGSVNCGNVGGSASAGGSVNCGSVGGSITAGGSVNHA